LWVSHGRSVKRQADGETGVWRPITSRPTETLSRSSSSTAARSGSGAKWARARPSRSRSLTRRP